MPVIALVQGNGQMRAAFRQGLKGSRLRLSVCRSRRHLDLVLSSKVVDAIVLELSDEHSGDVEELRSRYPGIPLFLGARFRPSDGTVLLGYWQKRCTNLLVEGVDDCAAAELVAAVGATARRAAALARAPKLLRLTEPLQLRVWSEVLWRADSRITTSDLARSVSVSREYLSREFAAGGAPNLKRVIDLARTLWATDLLTNPGYSVATVSRVLGYSSPSHLAASVWRIAGAKPRELPRLGFGGVLSRFVKGRTRSRV